MAIRKNVSALSSAERNDFVAAVKELKRIGKYDQYVLLHARAPMAKIHRGPAFFTWHRRMLIEFEEDLQEILDNRDFGVPYWHWGENAALHNPEDYTIWADDFLGGNGDSTDEWIVKTGPFRQGEWTIINMMGAPFGPLRRSFGVNPMVERPLPNHDEIAALLQLTPFDIAPWNSNSTGGFRNHMEGWIGGAGPQMHNLGHMWIGGSMVPMTSPNDPIFFLHHCFVDKLWWDWMQIHPDLEPYMPEMDAFMGQNLNDFIHPTMRATLRNSELLDINQLGYEYDTPEVFDGPSDPDNEEEPEIIDPGGGEISDPDQEDPPQEDPVEEPQEHPPVDDPVDEDPPQNDPPENDPVEDPVTEPEIEEPVENDPPPKQENNQPRPSGGGKKGCMVALSLLVMVVLFVVFTIS